ncbi:hypothetical protein N665_0046s0055, partial [Sinapis alba]
LLVISSSEAYECVKLSQQARLAQLVERKALNLVVVGSSPTVGACFFFISSRRNISQKGKNFDASQIYSNHVFT